MGRIKKDLVRIRLPNREAHNSRLFIDLCENIHIHYRELRIVFSLDEYFEFVDIVARSTEDVRSYLAQNPDYTEGAYRDTIMVAGGKPRQLKRLRNSPRPHESTYFANDFAIELQEETVIDEIHVHWRDYRFAVPRDHFRIIADAFCRARECLDDFEREHEYRRKRHPDREFDKPDEYADYDGRIMCEVDLPIAEIASKSSFEGRPDSIKVLVRQYRKGARVCPILVSTEVNGGHRVIDGHHRLRAAELAGLERINCVTTDLTFEESHLLRRAEGLLKQFDEATQFKYNTSPFIRQYVAERLNRFYGDHFHRIAHPPLRHRIVLQLKRTAERGKKHIRSIAPEHRFPGLYGAYRRIWSRKRDRAHDGIGSSRLR